MFYLRTKALRLLLITAATGWVLAGSAGAAPNTTPAVTSISVTLQVANTNTSKAPCFSDGQRYTVRGHLTGPASLLASRQAHAVTVYLFGYDVGEWNWTFDTVPGYDYVTDLAHLGHVSFTFDELGYGASGHPTDGNLTCFGAEADMAHQIIQHLRRGNYAMGDRPGIAFSKVALAGHDVGGSVAEIEAYSFGDIDALVQADWADQGQTQFIVQRAATAAAQWCTTSPAETPPGQPTSYVHFATEQDWRNGALFFDADPEVIKATDTLRAADPDPCGLIRSAAPTVLYNNPMALLSAAGTASPAPPGSPLSQITIPLLDVFGNNDTIVWTHQGEAVQQANFTGSQDKTTLFIPDAGHFPMFERTAPQFVHAIASWLAAHGV